MSADVPCETWTGSGLELDWTFAGLSGPRFSLQEGRVPAGLSIKLARKAFKP